MFDNNNFPKQAISYASKNKAWRESVIRWASENTVLTSSLIRKTVAHKKLNYDLINGKLDMGDLEAIVNPEGLKTGIPTPPLQHYNIMYNKLMLLRGEAAATQFDFKVIVTNPDAVSDIEEDKLNEAKLKIQKIVEQSQDDEDYAKRLEKLQEYMTYDYQDIRELRANELLKHYWKEYNMPELFNDGFMDVLAVNEEIYRCFINSGEPCIERLNPEKVYVYRSGYSNKVEDADMIVIEDYWSPGKIVDYFHNSLTKKQIDQIEEYGNVFRNDRTKTDPRNAFIWGENARDIAETLINDDNGVWLNFSDGVSSKSLPYDVAGNIRVLQVYWKSLRKVKKIKHYDEITGETLYDILPETYIPNEELGEEVTNLYINEAWQGYMIGAGPDAIFLDIKPCEIQYNRLFNPSKCHFGIVGTIYNINDSKPYSMVDMMKPYNYLYDVVHDRLNKLIARNWGKLIRLDLAKVPDNWKIEKWLHYAKAAGIAVEDSFKESNAGIAKGTIAGALNNNSNGVIDAELGNSIQAMISLLEYIKSELDVTGITRQREGQVMNRETVGGVERSTLQSSHVTRWLFTKHDDVKKRVLECFLETAKIALRGNSKKFQYILSDGSQKIIDLDGDEFAECDYGLVVDAGNDTNILNQKIETLAQAAMQGGVLSFSSMLKLFKSASLEEKTNLIAREEQQMREANQQAQQEQLQAQQQQAQLDLQLKQAELQLKDTMNQRDNETKLTIATMNQNTNEEPEDNSLEVAKFEESKRQFNDTLNLDKERFNFEKQSHTEDNQLQEKLAKLKSKQTNINKK